MKFIQKKERQDQKESTVLISSLALFLLITVSMPKIVYAIELEGLYSASVLVSSREDEREEDRAFTAAMSEVLLKVSGSNETLNINSIKQALRSPRSYVESWLYRSIQIEDENIEVALDGENQLAPSPEALELIELEITFFESEILNLLETNKLPLWPASRPFTLLWLVTQDELSDRELLSSGNESTDEVMALLSLKAEQRGLPLALPLMDLQDQRAVNINEIWSLDTEAILNASNRYEAESILVLRVYRSLSGELLGKARYIFRDRIQEYDSFEEDLDSFISNAINMSSEELSAYFSIRLSDQVDGFIVNLEIDNIDTAQSYASVLAYFDNLADVNSYQIVSIDKNTLALRLSTGGQFRQLIEAIGLESNLESVTNLNRNADAANMHYRWVD